MAKNEVNESVKPIIITDNETGEKYTLEFNRESVRFAEARGFKINELQDYPITRLPELFYYAFRMHHKNISLEKANRMFFDDLGVIPDGMLERLTQLYMRPFEALVDKDEEKAKNARLTVEL